MLCLKKKKRREGTERQRTKETEGGNKEKQGVRGAVRQLVRGRRRRSTSFARTPFPWRNKTKRLPSQEKATAEMSGYILALNGIFQGDFE